MGNREFSRTAVWFIRFPGNQVGSDHFFATVQTGEDNGGFGIVLVAADICTASTEPDGGHHNE